MKGLREHILAVETDDGPEDDARSWEVIGALRRPPQQWCRSATMTLGRHPGEADPAVAAATAPTAYVFVAQTARLLREARAGRGDRPRLRLDQGLRAGRSGAVRLRIARPRRHGGLRRARDWTSAAIAGVWPRSPSASFRSRKPTSPSRRIWRVSRSASYVGGGEFQLWPAFVKATGIDAKKINIVSMDPAGLDAGSRRQADQGRRQFLRQHRADLLGQQDRASTRCSTRTIGVQDVQHRASPASAPR